MDIDALRPWIGREETRSEVLTSGLAERFLATFDREGDSAEGAEAPLLIHLCLCQPVARTADLGPDGHPRRGGFLPPVSLPRRMWAGGEFRFLAPIRIGETVTRRSVIEDIQLKSGRSGPLCFVTLRHHITSNGRKVLEERQDIVYRDAPEGRIEAPRGPEPVHIATQTRGIAGGAPLLFRYSALTFNGHRIHYDTPYVQNDEGYADLVYHGPLQATLLTHFAADLRGTPEVFSFRSLVPILGAAAVTLAAAEDEGAMHLWTSGPAGGMAMEARARWTS